MNSSFNEQDMWVNNIQLTTLLKDFKISIISTNLEFRHKRLKGKNHEFLTSNHNTVHRVESQFMFTGYRHRNKWKLKWCKFLYLFKEVEETSTSIQTANGVFLPYERSAIMPYGARSRITCCVIVIIIIIISRLF